MGSRRRRSKPAKHAHHRILLRVHVSTSEYCGPRNARQTLIALINSFVLCISVSGASARPTCLPSSEVRVIRTLFFAVMFGFAASAGALVPTAALAQPASGTVAQAGQTTTGTITGKVVDGAGKPLGGARIGITGPNSTETTTKSDGTYSVAVPPGIYTVTISAAGFESTQQDTVAVVSGASVALATTLLPASLTTIGHVTVGFGSTSVSDTSASSTRLSEATIRSQGQDQVVNMLDQLPGLEVRTRRSPSAARNRMNRRFSSTAIRSTRSATVPTASTRPSSTRSCSAASR